MPPGATPPVASYRSWIFETHAPLDAFRYWFLHDLRSSGWTVEEADVYDHEIQGSPGRAHLRLTYHEDGLQLDAKIRTGLLRGSTGNVADALLEAGRRAQTRVRSGADSAPPEPNG